MGLELTTLGGQILELLLLVGVRVSNLQLGALLADRLPIKFGDNLLTDFMSLHTV